MVRKRNRRSSVKYLDTMEVRPGKDYRPSLRWPGGLPQGVPEIDTMEKRFPGHPKYRWQPKAELIPLPLPSSMKQGYSQLHPFEELKNRPGEAKLISRKKTLANNIAKAERSKSLKKRGRTTVNYRNP